MGREHESEERKEQRWAALSNVQKAVEAWRRKRGLSHWMPASVVANQARPAKPRSWEEVSRGA